MGKVEGMGQFVKLPVENGYGSGLISEPKIQELQSHNFPRDCGQNVRPVSLGTTRASAANAMENMHGAGDLVSENKIVEVNDLKIGEGSKNLEIEKDEALFSHDKDKQKDMCDALDSNNLGSANGDAMVLDIEKMGDCSQVKNVGEGDGLPLQPTKGPTVSACVNGNMMRRYPPRGRVSAIRDFPLSCGNKELEQKATASSNDNNQPTKGPTVSACVNGNMMRRYPPRGRVSAIRDFPLSCGNKELELKATASSNNNSLGLEIVVGEHKLSADCVTADVRQSGKNIMYGDSSTSKMVVIASQEADDDDRGSSEDGGRHEDNHLGQKSCGSSLSIAPFGVSSSGAGDGEGGNVTRNRVRDTLRRFQAEFRKILHKNEAGSRRVDLAAAMVLKKQKKYINTGKAIMGPVPGIEVGDEFHYRVELNIVGLHRASQAGIDYLKEGNDIFATSIVASGGYPDDLENSDSLVYTGSGGNVAQGKKDPEDQKLERGNLALKNSVYRQNHVRVIRGFKESKAAESWSESRAAKSLMTYTYDGLYLVTKYWQEMAQHGKLVYKFQLNRIPGQPELAWK